MDPLPDANDPDDLQAQWARMRAAELGLLASRLEPIDAIEAHRTWLHALCLDPDGAAVAAGVARTITVAVMRAAPLEPADDTEPEPLAAATPAALAPTPPDVAAAPPAAMDPTRPDVDAEPPVAVEPTHPEVAAQAAAAIEPTLPDVATDPPAPMEPSAASEPPVAADPPLGEPPVASLSPASPVQEPRAAEPARERCGPTPRTCPPLRSADRALAKVEALVQGAHFDEAVALQRRARAALEPLGATPLGRDRRARLEVLIGTAHVALGRRDLALESFERALAADPTLELDRARTSPKVMRVFDEVRTGTLARRGG
jgi:hypothetical protein